MTEPTLIDFLRARLDEREKDIGDGHGLYCAALDPCYEAPKFGDPDPSRCDCAKQWKLTDLAAKRQIIELHLPKDNFPTECRTCTWNDPWEGFFSLDVPCPTLRLLALPWASHPDYRPEWAPEVKP